MIIGKDNVNKLYKNYNKNHIILKIEYNYIIKVLYKYVNKDKYSLKKWIIHLKIYLSIINNK